MIITLNEHDTIPNNNDTNDNNNDDNNHNTIHDDTTMHGSNHITRGAATLGSKRPPYLFEGGREGEREKEGGGGRRHDIESEKERESMPGTPEKTPPAEDDLASTRWARAGADGAARVSACVSLGNLRLLQPGRLTFVDAPRVDWTCTSVRCMHKGWIALSRKMGSDPGARNCSTAFRSAGRPWLPIRRRSLQSLCLGGLT